MRKMKRNTVFSTRGKCVYCGDDSQPSRLTIEHVIPEAIGGQITVDKASCQRCQVEIGRFEGRLNNGLFGNIRALLQIAGKSKPRENVLVYRQTEDTNTLTRDYTNNKNHPGFIFIEALLSPRLERGQLSPPPGPRRINIVAKNITASPGERGSGIDLLFVNYYVDFTRLLAKIAHSYWMGERGDLNFHPFLNDFIIGKEIPDMSYLIGRNENITDHIDDLHWLSSGTKFINAVEYCFVDIALFSCFQVYNGYRVYTGNLGDRKMVHFISP